MKEQILKLAKRLNKFTPDDIERMTGYAEKEIFEVLEEFVERKQIKKLSKNRYVFEKSYFVGKLNVSGYLPEGIGLTQEDIEEYKNADRYARKYADKYIRILESSNGLRGKELDLFIEEWNLKNPSAKISAARIHTMRRKLLQEGIRGLLGKNYKALTDRKKLNETIYVYFREFFLSPKLLTSNQALNLAVKKYLEDYPNFNLSTLAQATTYRKRLRAEYTVEEINFHRSNYISKGVLKKLKQISSEE